MKVLAVIPGDGQGGSMIFCRRQAERMRLLGVDIKIFYLKSRTSLLPVWKEYCRLRREIRSFDPHVVHAHYGTMTGWISVMSTRRPVVITFRGSDLNPIPSSSPWRARLGHLLSHLAARRASRIICVSDGLRQRLRGPRKRAEVIPMGVNLDVFRPIEKSLARTRLNWDDKEPIVLFNAGREPRVKRLDLAEKAIEVARSCGMPNIRMFVMNGDVMPDQVPLMMNAADLLLFTSDYEGSPNIVKEAMACGLPVVSVSVGDVERRMEKVFPAAVVKRDPESIGLAICEMIVLGRRSNGREIVSQELSDIQAAKRTIKEIVRAGNGVRS